MFSWRLRLIREARARRNPHRTRDQLAALHVARRVGENGKREVIQADVGAGGKIGRVEADGEDRLGAFLGMVPCTTCSRQRSETSPKVNEFTPASLPAASSHRIRDQYSSLCP